MMTTNHHTPIPKGAAGNAATVNAPLGQLDAAITNIVNGDTHVNQLNLGLGATATIVGGAVTAARSLLTLSAETGTTDDLDTLNGDAGDLVMLSAAPGHTLTVKHNTGNIYLSGLTDLVLSDSKSLLLYKLGSTYVDMLTAGSYSGRKVLVARTALGAAAASVTVINSAIPAGFAYLELVIVAKLVGTGAGVKPDLIFNNDNATNYNTVISTYSSGSPVTTFTASDNGFPLVTMPTGSVSGWGTVKAQIMDYDSTSKYKGVQWDGWAETPTPGQERAIGSGYWKNAASAISRIDVTSSVNFDVGTYYELWGV